MLSGAHPAAHLLRIKPLLPCTGDKNLFAITTHGWVGLILPWSKAGLMGMMEQEKGITAISAMGANPGLPPHQGG